MTVQERTFGAASEEMTLPSPVRTIGTSNPTSARSRASADTVALSGPSVIPLS